MSRRENEIMRPKYRQPLERIRRTTDRLSQAERSEWCSAIESDLQSAAFLLAYLEDRGVAGCGDNGHESAVKAGERQKKQVRRIVGFTNP